ncbi:MAG: 50S ribosomal protein L30 [Bacteroidota bacterium]|nr:50S ribosomal protein L30 [Bacteroidota bacterium]MDP4234720.1 50S ribosomal protein L30 [Bacteroidota bacterium]MDP4243943.1 50S ribosomal protein L30 [Bacteroidota bacterium]MDP4288834.1 50S ribosomal protein L30 [Bacteroidota bacterium]
MATTKKILIRQTRSICDTLERHKRTIKALGLGRPNYVAVHDDTPAVRGMVRAVQHLVVVEETK